MYDLISRFGAYVFRQDSTGPSRPDFSLIADRLADEPRMDMTARCRRDEAEIASFTSCLRSFLRRGDFSAEYGGNPVQVWSLPEGRLARRLNLAQPTVSQAVRRGHKIAEDLGLNLLGEMTNNPMDVP